MGVPIHNELADVNGEPRAHANRALMLTPAEQKAGVVPRHLMFLPGRAERYGCVGDDSTDNDAAIADALAVLEAAGGGDLDFPLGIFRVSAGIVLPSNTTLRGAGMGATIFRSTSTDDEIIGILIPNGSDRCILQDFSLIGEAKVGIGVCLGSTGYSSDNLVQRVGIRMWERGLVVRAALWNTISECLIGSATAGIANTVGVDFDAGGSFAAANALTIEKTKILFNDGPGVQASSTPVNCLGLRWLGGSIEGNCSDDPSEPQFHVGNQIAFELSGIYFEYLGGGTKPDAIWANGLGSGVIKNCVVQGSSYAIRDPAGGNAATWITIFGCQFTDTAVECMHFVLDTGITAFGNSEDVGSTITGPASSHATGALVDQSANEDGWTPSLRGSTTAGTPTHAIEDAYVNVLANQVFIRGRVGITSKTGMVGALQIAGLPYTSANQPHGYAMVTIDQSGLSNASGYSQFVGRISPNSNVIDIIETGSGQNASLVPIAQVGTTTTIAFSAAYTK